MNSGLPEWIREQEHFSCVCREIRNQMELVDDVTPDTYLTPVIPYDVKYRMGDELYDNE